MSQPLFCLGKDAENTLFGAIEAHILSAFPDVTVKHDRTQTAFVRKVQFAWVSLPRRKSDAGAVMLSIGAIAPLRPPGCSTPPRSPRAAGCITCSFAARRTSMLRSSAGWNRHGRWWAAEGGKA